MMRRAIAIACAGFSLAGCSSFSMDMLKSAPPEVPVQLESTPPGAEAKTSLGPSCKTPCSVQVAAPDSGFSVTFNLDKFQPETVQVQVIRNSGAFNTSPPVVLDPNPVTAELQPAAPAPKAKRMRPKRIKKPAAASPANAAVPAAPQR